MEIKYIQTKYERQGQNQECLDKHKKYTKTKQHRARQKGRKDEQN